MKKSKLIKYCNLIAILTAVYGLIIFYKLYSVGYDIGWQLAISEKAGTPFPIDLMWNILSQAIVVFAVFAISLLFFMFVVNVRKGLIFVSENAQLLMTYGIIVTILGVLSIIADRLSSISNLILNSGLLVLIGICFVFVSIIFKIGIELQQEQDLTI